MSQHTNPTNDLPVGKPQRRALLLLHATLLIYSMASIFAKLSSNQLNLENDTGALVFLALEFVALAVYSLLWQVVLKRMPLNVAYSSKALSTLWTWLLCFILLHESITLGKAIGIVLVLAGVYLVVTDHE